MLEFTVIDTTTNEYPDLWEIATTEEWAKHLMYCDMEGFAISEDGGLLLLDECGGIAYCPTNRFKVVHNEIGSLTFFCHDLGETISIHDYLKKLLSTLWREQDEFSGKRPFGNSGWMHDIMACLISYEIIPGTLDEEGYVVDGDYEKGDSIIREYIERM